MQLKSLGYETDLIFSRFDGEVQDHGEFVVITAPANPGFYWGNFVLFRQPPQAESVSEWEHVFHEHIASKLSVHHQTFGWDDPVAQGNPQAFVDAGYKFLNGVVLTATSVVVPPKHNDHIETRVLNSDQDWAQALELQVHCREPHFSQTSYRAFRNNQLRRYRAMEAAGRGHWFGAFIDGRLVADLGVFAEGEIARFQSVETHPEFRRLGICGTLVHWASNFAFESMQVKTLVMVADADYHAARIYESVGFRPHEHQFGLERFDPEYA